MTVVGGVKFHLVDVMGMTPNIDLSNNMWQTIICLYIDDFELNILDFD